MKANNISSDLNEKLRTDLKFFDWLRSLPTSEYFRNIDNSDILLLQLQYTLEYKLEVLIGDPLVSNSLGDIYGKK